MRGREDSTKALETDERGEGIKRINTEGLNTVQR